MDVASSEFMFCNQDLVGGLGLEHGKVTITLPTVICADRYVLFRGARAAVHATSMYLPDSRAVGPWFTIGTALYE